MISTVLLEKIRAKYKSDAAFGLAIGWTPQKVFKFVRGNYIPKVSEAVAISRAIGTTVDEFASFFAD